MIQLITRVANLFLLNDNAEGLSEVDHEVKIIVINLLCGSRERVFK